jgi:hypothetical protein
MLAQLKNIIAKFCNYIQPFPRYRAIRRSRTFARRNEANVALDEAPQEQVESLHQSKDLHRAEYRQAAGKAFTLAHEKFWGYPMLMVATKDEALALAQTLLPSEQAATRAL